MKLLNRTRRWFPRRRRVVLASSSPRRRELLGFTGIEFVVSPQEVDESVQQGESPREHVERLALEKAAAAAAGEPDAIVLGCDTVVVLGEKRILGKPAHREDARRMLYELGGREHTVLSSVAAVWLAQHKRRQVTVETRVRIKQLERWEVEWYLKSGEPMDKAGAYAIQGRGGVFVEGIVGSYSNVVGLPLMETVMLLRGFGIRL